MLKNAAILFAFGLVILTLFQSDALGVERQWPKEYRDIFYGNCVIALLQGSDPSDEIRRAIEGSCQCQVERAQKILSVQDLKDLQSMPADKRDSDPKAQKANRALEECGIENKLEATMEAELDKPLSQKTREVILMHCVWTLTREYPDLEEGKNKLADACLCVADELAPSHRTLREFLGLGEEKAESTLRTCKEIHAPSR